VTLLHAGRAAKTWSYTTDGRDAHCTFPNCTTCFSRDNNFYLYGHKFDDSVAFETDTEKKAISHRVEVLPFLQNRTILHLVILANGGEVPLLVHPSCIAGRRPMRLAAAEIAFGKM
jgi:hypothetical protein